MGASPSAETRQRGRSYTKRLSPYLGHVAVYLGNRAGPLVLPPCEDQRVDIGQIRTTRQQVLFGRYVTRPWTLIQINCLKISVRF